MHQSIAESGSVRTRRFVVQILSGFSVLALALAAVGLYGVMAYLVIERRREIAVRMALGATRSVLFKQILGEAGRLLLRRALRRRDRHTLAYQVDRFAAVRGDDNRPRDTSGGVPGTGHRRFARQLPAGTARRRGRSDGRLARIDDAANPPDQRSSNGQTSKRSSCAAAFSRVRSSRLTTFITWSLRSADPVNSKTCRA